MKASTPKISRSEESLLFFKQLMKNPRSLGAVAPSSYKLADFICQHVPVDGNFIVEVGAGTGRLTQALLKSGLNPSHLAIVELDKDMCAFLEKNFPQVNVIHGNACELDTLLPLSWRGKVGTIISGIPMRNVSLDQHKLMVTSFLNVLKESGNILQFSYGPLSPLSVKKLGLQKKRLGHIFLNIPPATVWQYSKSVAEPIRVGAFKPRLNQFKIHIQSKLGDRK